MLVLNFAHPLTAEQIAQVEALTGQPVDRVHGETPQLDPGPDFVSQARALAERVGLSADAWQTTPLLLNPPGYAPAAAVLLAELHGRIGHFPALLRLREAAGSLPPRYEVAEIVNLQAVRNQARARRQE